MLAESSSTEVLFVQARKTGENQAKRMMNAGALHEGARADTIEF